MRQYRGKRIDNGEWVYGWYAELYDAVFEVRKSLIWPRDTEWHCVRVIPDSVGQSTGEKDKNDVEIYDGDIVRLCYGIPPTFDTLRIEYADNETVVDISVSGWWMRNIREKGVSGSLCKTYENDLEIIGNVTDNPDLLEQGK